MTPRGDRSERDPRSGAGARPGTRLALRRGMNTARIVTFFPVMLVAAAIAACADPAEPEDDAAVIAAALELENGGYSTEDESPEFADPWFAADLEPSTASESEGEQVRARGRWRQVGAAERGRLGGVVRDPSGERVGHLRGVWGQRADGQRVFFAKAIDLAGRFRGVVAGHYAEGDLVGTWARGECEGADVEGVYGASLAEPELGVGFVLRWEPCR